FLVNVKDLKKPTAGIESCPPQIVRMRKTGFVVAQQVIEKGGVIDANCRAVHDGCASLTADAARTSGKTADRWTKRPVRPAKFTVRSDQACTSPCRIAYLTRPAVEWMSSFSITFTRWVSAVLAATPRTSAISFVVLPSATS